MLIRTNRSILTYILLNILTCGLYHLYFVQTLAEDVNQMCAADGRKTAGALPYFLLSFFTCGIYSIYWNCMVAERLQYASRRYGAPFSEGGSTVAIWNIASLLCFPPLIYYVYYILINNTNRLGFAYNAFFAAGMQNGTPPPIGGGGYMPGASGPAPQRPPFRPDPTSGFHPNDSGN